MPKKRKPRSHSNHTGSSRPRPDDVARVKDFLIRQGEKTIAAEILNFLSAHDGQAFRSRDIAAELGYLSDDDLPGFWYVLHKLHEEGALDKDAERRYSLARSAAPLPEVIRVREELALHADTQVAPFVPPTKPRFKVGEIYEGTLKTHPNGYGLVSVADYDDEIFLPANELREVLDGDVVKVRVTLAPLEVRANRESFSRRFEGKLVEVLARTRTELVGILKRRNKGFQFIPDSNRILPEVFISLKDAKTASDGDKVVIGKLQFAEDGVLTGKVIEVLGKSGDSKVEVAAIARALGIDATFPKSVLAEANKLSDTISDEELANRIDYRDKIVFTIDPYDAKDFDDALSIEMLDNGLYYVGVHIADVSHYVREGTKLDEEAQRRSTSVYLVDRVIPMLPSNLSENICSLNPHVDRLAYSIFFTMTHYGKVLDYHIAKTVIHSRRRFTYEQVQEILDAGEGEFYEQLHALHRLSKILSKERFANGSIDFDTEELKFKLDESGKPIEVMRKVRLDSHRLIEEFMLLANRTVATHIATHFQNDDLNYPSIYRVHDTPNPEKIKTLAAFVKRLGYELELKKNALNNETATSQALRKLLSDVKGTSVEYMVSEIALRAMAKAVYSPKNIGHYGLGFDFYTHFTSPIRRYPDLVTHRLLYEYETLRQSQRKLSKPRLRKLNTLIPAICEHASEQERNATEAERDSVKLKQVEYISDHIGSLYTGIISGVTDFGIYVRLNDMGVEGLVHIKNMLDDYYEFDERTYSLVGKRTHRRYQLGQTVRIKVHAVDTKRRTIDFLLA